MTHTKYHGSGRLYTEMELQDREHALSRQYFMYGYHGHKRFGPDGKEIKERQLDPYRKYHGRG